MHRNLQEFARHLLHRNIKEVWSLLSACGRDGICTTTVIQDIVTFLIEEKAIRLKIINTWRKNINVELLGNRRRNDFLLGHKKTLSV